MNVEVKKDTAGVPLVRIAGEVDMHTSPKVRNALLPLFDKSVKGVVVDLSGVTFMDSSGVATMVEGLQWSTRENKRFILAGLEPRIMDVFVLTNLKDLFEFSQDFQEAIDNIS